MKEQIAVDKLAKGMFVAELDRPWLESPFLIQGFVIDSQEQIEQLQHCCEHVFVERTQSLGDQFRAGVAEKSALQRTRTEPHAKAQNDNTPDKPDESLLGAIGRILRAAFSSVRRPDAAERPTTAAPARPASAQESPVIIHEDKPKPKPAPREMGISQEERAYIERATDPTASVRVYTEKELAARGGWLRRIARLFGLRGAGAGGEQSGGRDSASANAPVYVDMSVIEEELPLAKEAHKKVEAVVQEVIADLSNNKAPDLEKVGEAVGWMVQSVVRNPDGLIWLSRLKSVDAYTYNHGLNTAIYLIAFGRHMGLPEAQLQVIGTVGLMQDVGKVKIPPALLNKRGKPTAAELLILQNHVTHSVEILRASKDMTQELIDAVRQHHERYDGSGYPNGLAGDAISTLGGMAGLVDAYTAMISARPYAKSISVQQALHELYSTRNKSFRADLVEAFIQCVGVFPVGSLVELNTSEVAVVVSQNRARRLKPRVMLVMDSERQPFAAPTMLDLVTDPPTPTGEPYRIVRGLQAGLYDVDPEHALDAVMQSK